MAERDLTQIGALQRELAELRREKAWIEANESWSAAFRKQALEKVNKDIEAKQVLLDSLGSV